MNYQSYDKFSRFLHWSMAFVIIYTSVTGYSMHLVHNSHPQIWKFLSVLNMSLATLVVPLFFVRVFWRYFRQSTVLPKSIPLRQRQLAKMTHSTIYFMMFMVFSSGLLMQEKGFYFFGIIYLSNIITDISINKLFFDIHRYSCISLVLLIIIHIGAVLKHHFISKNAVFKMMLPSSENKCDTDKKV